MSELSSYSDASNPLIPGTGYAPNYGVEDEGSAHSDVTGSTRTAASVASVQNQAGSRVWVVARCSLVVCLASLVSGMNGGFNSATLLELQNVSLTTPAQHFSRNGTLPNLFGALGTAGAMFGGIVAWPISDHFGRQAALIVGGVPFLFGWLLIANAIQITSSRHGFLMLLLTGRSLTGFATGWSVFCVSVYIAEVSSSKQKGLFGNCNQLFMTLGILLTYFLSINFRGYKFRYSDVALVAAGVVALFELLMLTTYETPRWLFSKNHDFDGIRVLKILRGKHFMISKEISSIKAVLRHVHSKKEQLKAFKNRTAFQPLILVIFLMFFQQFSGINAAIFYSSQIFSDAGYNSDKANLATFGAVGCAQVVATLMSVVLVDSLGRQVLLVASSIGMAASSLLLGVYFYIFDKTCMQSLQHPECPSHIEYLAICSVVVYIISFSLGWGPIPWTIMSELLPNQVRTLGGSIGSLASWGFATSVIFAFPAYRDLVTPKFTWWSFCFIMVVSIAFVLLFVPETKGQSLEEIQEHFENGGVFACSCSCCCKSRDDVLDETSSFNHSQRSYKSQGTSSSINYLTDS